MRSLAALLIALALPAPAAAVTFGEARHGCSTRTRSV
jgi:hypothetical protein